MEKLALHYYLEGGIHSMDAFVKNKAELEIIRTFEQISKILAIDLKCEIEALEEGGIKEYFRLITRNDLLTGAIITIAAGVITHSLTTDTEYSQLQKEEIKLNIQKLKTELNETPQENTEKKVQIINNITVVLCNHDKIKSHKSNLYSALLNDSAVEEFSTSVVDASNNLISEEYKVKRKGFDQFIIDDNTAESEIIRNAEIEVTSPVFNSIKQKWKGIYDSTSFSFSLLDDDFKTSVFNKEFSFTNGTTIKCTLEKERVLTEEGTYKVIAYNVYSVLEVNNDNKTIKTKLAKQIEQSDNDVALKE